MRMYKVVETNESASLEVQTVSGCDAQPWHDEDTEESVIEEAISHYYAPSRRASKRTNTCPPFSRTTRMQNGCFAPLTLHWVAYPPPLPVPFRRVKRTNMW